MINSSLIKSQTFKNTQVNDDWLNIFYFVISPQCSLKFYIESDTFPFWTQDSKRIALGLKERYI